VLCSDGLHGVVDDDGIRRIAAGDDPRAAAQGLIAAALAGGAPDNVSVGVFLAMLANAPAHVQEGDAARKKTRPVDRWVETGGEPPAELLARGGT
jgi:hypothetical protein